MPRSVLIVRHGNRADFANPAWRATAERPDDPPLSPQGVAQVDALARRLGGESIRHVFSSPFLRCVQSADILADRLATDVKIDDGLSEWLNAEWFPASPKLAPLTELRATFPHVDPTYVSRGSARWGESGVAALRRSGDTVLRLVAEFPGDLLLVGHGASILGATAALLGVGADATDDVLPAIPNASLIRLSERSGRWRLELACDVSHLPHGG